MRLMADFWSVPLMSFCSRDSPQRGHVHMTVEVKTVLCWPVSLLVPGEEVGPEALLFAVPVPSKGPVALWGAAQYSPPSSTLASPDGADVLFHVKLKCFFFVFCFSVWFRFLFRCLTSPKLYSSANFSSCYVKKKDWVEWQLNQVFLALYFVKFDKKCIYLFVS